MRMRGGAWVRVLRLVGVGCAVVAAGTLVTSFRFRGFLTVGGMKVERSSGVQLHLTSLADGRLGPSAYRFVDWLAAAGQSWWQVLPPGPPQPQGPPDKARPAFPARRG